MRNGFQRIIEKINPEAKVLDVGAWGLGGENTTRFLQGHFKKVICLNREQIGHAVDIVADFYACDFKEKFDVVVLDMNLKENIDKDWTNRGMERVYALLNPRGILIIHIIASSDREYQDTNILNLFNLLAIYPEGRRKDIVWLALQKK